LLFDGAGATLRGGYTSSLATQGTLNYNPGGGYSNVIKQLGSGIWSCGNDARVHLTTNGGANWSYLNFWGGTGDGTLCYDLAQLNNTVVAVGSNSGYIKYATSNVASSASWSAASTDAGANVASVAAGNGYFVATRSDRMLMYSPDGQYWSFVATPAGYPTANKAIVRWHPVEKRFYVAVNNELWANAAESGSIVDKVGLDPVNAAYRSIDIKAANPSATTGWYWIRTNGFARKYWVDMDYDGGGWVLVGSHPQNVAIPALSHAQAAQSYDGYGSSTYGIGDPKTYATWVGLNAWTAITSANSAGKNLVYYVAGTATSLGNTAAHSLRSRLKWAGWTSNFAFSGANSLVNELGATDPGLWSYHIAGGYGFSTYDNNLTAGCNYNYAPWWYGSCWSGSLWGGNGGGAYYNMAFWNSSGSDYHAYGAIYIK